MAEFRLCPNVHHVCSPISVRPPGGAPQLKRDPLGRTRTSNSFLRGIARRASAAAGTPPSKSGSRVGGERGGSALGLKPLVPWRDRGAPAATPAGRGSTRGFSFSRSTASWSVPPVRRHKASPVGLSGGERRPNKRLKLAAPGFGRNCVCAPATSVLVSINVVPASLGAAA